MNDMACPWCEVTLELQVDSDDDQQCPECLTSWRFEDDYVSEFALAA